MRFALAPRGVAQWLAALARLAVILVVIMAALFTFLRMPGSSLSGPLPALTAAEKSCARRLAGHVRHLAGDIGPRNIWTYTAMAETVAYLRNQLGAMGYDVHELPFTAKGVTSVNVEVEIRGSRLPDEIIVVGAHYDTVFGCPGANDNGSGVAALLELARLLKVRRPQRTIRLVAFANEEPPFFPGKSMGSRVYAMAARKRGDDIRAMLALETMGFYSEAPGSQRYPFPLASFYPDQADFIAFVGNLRSRSLVRQAIGAFRSAGRMPSEGLAAPFFITGVGWSDHWSFWQEGYPAMMVTDTAFYRYDAYHSAEDTPERLDYPRLARVVSGLVPTVLALAAGEEPLDPTLSRLPSRGVADTGETK